MKAIKFFSIILCCLFITTIASAQKRKTESFKVSGECGMCKKKIEKAAKEAGASQAVWNSGNRILKISYNISTTSTASIQQAIANVGYNTPLYNASAEAYNSLDECCKYEPKEVGEKCCGKECKKEQGKCIDTSKCKEKGCDTDKMKCCKKS